MGLFGRKDEKEERQVSIKRLLSEVYMPAFAMVKYHKKEYPSDIPLQIEEIAAHFDAASINSTLDRSLHTEYSYAKRRFESTLVMCYPSIVDAQKDGVPQLWKNESWAEEFAQFVVALNGRERPPRVIEVHPPFDDYTDMRGFICAYSVFEERILAEYPGIDILIENRSGSIYRGGSFLIETVPQLSDLCDKISGNALRLKIALDIPQLYTAHAVQSINGYLGLLDSIEPLRDYIGGVHLWGKSRSKTGRKVSHCGDLNSYFEYDATTKQLFLERLFRCFDDDIIRKMVLEVNSSNEDMLSIINDLRSVGIRFV